MRLTPKYANVIISPRQSKHDSGQPRAKIIASRLQYATVLLRTVTSYKSGRRYLRTFQSQQATQSLAIMFTLYHWQGYAVT